MLRRLSALPIDKFLLALLATVAVATVLPAAGTAADVLSVVTKAAIALLFWLYGTRLSPQQALAGLRHWQLHLLVLAVTFVVFPVLGLIARSLVPTVLTIDLYTGLLFLCLVPSTVQSSIAFTSIARGNVSAAIVSASVSNIVGVVVTPLLVMLLMHTGGVPGMDPTAIRDIVVQLLLPFVAGQLMRPWVADWIARHGALTRVVDRGSILLVVYTAFSIGMTRHIWTTVTPWRVAAVAVISAVLLALVMAITVVAGQLAEFSRADRIVLLFCGSKKSLASGLPMALVLFPAATVGITMLPLMLFHQIQLIVCAVIAGRLARTADAAAGPA
ncbi:hypothetical protein AWC30_10170 [Mycolicibacillus trivialis]|uniref:Bile acid:sodium symporter n=1 Tax=Mycolicibacillus trivialis TaxID=1798 RepID=A0A1X2EJL2_9MYCO|nr:hypothetical protein AWC30_10170 [Mycolicibacillus trivialis]